MRPREGKRPGGYRAKSARAALVLSVAAWLLLGCGAGKQETVLARVSGVAIARSAVDHWAGVIKRGGSGVGQGFSGTPRERALAFLIQARWLRDETAALGVAVSGDAVEHVLQERRAGGDEGEFLAILHAAGQTPADVRLEAKSELAAAALRRRLERAARHVSRAEVLAYYRRNPRLFSTKETRVVDIVEDLPSRAAAAALTKRVGTGQRFNRKGLHEVLQRGSVSTAAGIPGKAAVVHAIFTAQVGAVSPPMPLNHGWTVFVLRRIVPARLKPLGTVSKTIEGRLRTARLNKLRSEFLRSYRMRWSAVTLCGSGLVVPGCAQYRGALGPQADGLDLGS